MKITCDLGEGFSEIDKQVMPYIDMASIACGGHAGDKVSMTNCVQAALSHNTEIGAHPSYPDRENFGRKTMPLSSSMLKASLFEQLLTLHKVCVSEGTKICYIKPHGALYNDMMSNPNILQVILQTCKHFQSETHSNDLFLVVQALPETSPMNFQKKEKDITVRYEAFSDRGYADNGFLLARGDENAVFTEKKSILEQATTLSHGFLITNSGKRINIQADCLCIHGDNPISVNSIAAIRKILPKMKNA